MPGLSAAPAVAEEITEPNAPDAPQQAAPQQAALQPVALEASAASRIDPAEAADVWQENLSARTGQPWAGGRQPNGASRPAEIAADAADPVDEYLVDLWPGDFADQSHGVEG